MSDAMRSLAVIVALGVGVAGCSTGGGGPSPSDSARPAIHGVTFARAKVAYQRYRGTIQRRYAGVQGTQVGVVVIRSRLPRPGDPVYGIVVLVDKPAHLVEDPQPIGGVPLRFSVGEHTVMH